MASVVRTIQSVQLPSGPGNFSLDLITDSILLAEDAQAPGSILILVETGVLTTANRTFTLVALGGLVADDKQTGDASDLEYVCQIAGQVPMSLFERIS